MAFKQLVPATTLVLMNLVLCRAWCNEGDLVSADRATTIAELSKMIDTKVAPTQALLSRARLYRQAGKYQLAVNDCSRIRQMNSTADEALEERAKNYDLMGKKQLAADDREELKYQREHRAKFNRAISDKSKADAKAKNGAVDKTIITGAPDTVPSGLSQLEYYHLARSYGGVRPKQALKCVTLAEQINPRSGIALKAHLLRESILPKQMPTEEAIGLNRLALRSISKRETCRKLIATCLAHCPNWEQAYITLGGLEKDSGDDAAAERNFRHALVLNPHNVEALSRLADTVADHNLNEAQSLWQQAIRYDPDDTYDGAMLESHRNDH